jgi:hypothetical protein
MKLSAACFVLLQQRLGYPKLAARPKAVVTRALSEPQDPWSLWRNSNQQQ